MMAYDGKDREPKTQRCENSSLAWPDYFSIFICSGAKSHHKYMKTKKRSGYVGLHVPYENSTIDVHRVWLNGSWGTKLLATSSCKQAAHLQRILLKTAISYSCQLGIMLALKLVYF